MISPPPVSCLSQQGADVDWSGHLRELAKGMSSDQIADAERMVTEWRLAQDSPKAEGLGSLADLVE